MQTEHENSMAAVFQKQVARYGNRACVAYKKDGRYQDISWNEMDEMIRAIGSYLISTGIEPGQNVALFSPNRYEWWVIDQAILSIGAANVPIYATNSAEEAKYVLEHSESRVCFVGEQEHMEKVVKVRDSLPDLKGVVVFDEVAQKPEGVITFAEALEEGRKHDNREEFDRRLKAVNPNDVASIIYTSGTTGPPKGVMLSHSNFLSNVHQILDDFSHLVGDEDEFLSFLPLSHSLERTAGYYLAVAIGGKVYFAEDFAKLQENLVEVHPTLIVSVPRLYEKVHVGILSKLGDASPVKRALFGWAIGVARDNLPYVCQGKPRTGWFKFKHDLADKLIFSKLKAALGMDRLKFAVSGGGPLSVADAEFFLGMGITVLEGFGLTETTPVTNVNRPCMIKPGTVGPPVKDTEIKIADDGEILIRGPQIMLGYYKNEEATKEVLNEDGFFCTGDLGKVDEDQCLMITGRKKEIIVTSGGKNIAPQNIENSVKGSRFVEQVSVIGDRRKYLSALIVPNFEELTKWADKVGISYKSRDELLNSERVQHLYEKVIAKYMKEFSRAEQIRKFSLLPDEWTQQTGELTPTLKCKRRVIEEKYRDEIECMYPQ
ncbi:MAG: AMP-dependent synthetase/ligase [Thermodesulfobacteriota bacterium]